MKFTIPMFLVVILTISLAPNPTLGAEPTFAETAWNEGYPLRGLKNGTELVSKFKVRAGNLGKNGKLRILIIGDSLSEGYEHWSHHFREQLQAAYGDGGPGTVWSIWQGNAREGWLFNGDDFAIATRGGWRRSWGGRGDIWPYLGWNGEFLATEFPDASFQLDARGSQFTVVTSIGSFETFDGHKVDNRSAGFTAQIGDQVKKIPPAHAGDPLDVSLTRFDVPDGRHRLTIDAVNDGTLFLHGVLVENSAPGVVVSNISRGGYWASNYLWRQPGWEKILAAINPDLTILFLSKPESGGSGTEGGSKTFEHEALRLRVARAVPRSDLLVVIGWLPRDGQSPSDARSMDDRIAWCESNHFPYLNLRDGLDPRKMADFHWFADNIHLAPAGGQGIGDGVARLFRP